MKQLIISLGRESGSGGHEIAEKAGPAVFPACLRQKPAPGDRQGAAAGHGDLAQIRRSPQKPPAGPQRPGLNNSMQASVFAIESSWLRNQADSGASFVIVGRCAESVLADCPGLVSLFISGDPEAHRPGSRPTISTRSRPRITCSVRTSAAGPTTTRTAPETGGTQPTTT